MTSLRWYAIAAAAVVSIGSLRIISTYGVFSHTVDEPDNLAAGMSTSARAGISIMTRIRPSRESFRRLDQTWPVRGIIRGRRRTSKARIFGTGDHYDRVLALARGGILPFFWAASLVVFLWGRRAGGPAAAVWATALFTTPPAIT